jgi:transcriptional regulator with XRE-family HTH domain
MYHTMKPLTALQKKLQLQFGLQVRKHRLIACLTQKVLAQRARLFQSYIGRIESGEANPTLLVIVALAQALLVPIDALMPE